jgi:Tfp pilus assembly major pilin PilA
MLFKNDLTEATNKYWFYLGINVSVSFLVILLVTGIMLSMASTYTAKARVAEAFAKISAYKSEITTDYLAQGHWPKAYLVEQSDADFGGIIQKIEFDGKGSIHVFFNSSEMTNIGDVLTYAAAEVSNVEISNILWVCGYASVPEYFELIGQRLSTVNRVILPRICK